VNGRMAIGPEAFRELRVTRAEGPAGNCQGGGEPGPHGGLSLTSFARSGGEATGVRTASATVLPEPRVHPSVGVGADAPSRVRT
jgi:hypothetical protein